MSLTLLDKSSTAMPQAIQQNLIAYMRMFSGLTGVVTVDTPDVFWMVSHAPAPGNIVLRASFSGDTERQIDSLFKAIGEHIDEIGWFVFPHDWPTDLGKRLEARGMTSGRGGYWLSTDLNALGAPPAAPDGFRVDAVRDDAMLTEWLRASEAGFGHEYPLFYDAYARHGYGPEAFSLHYIGYLGDTPVTSGTLLDAGGTASLYDISTPPQFRGRGFGGALTHFLMREVRNRGYNETFIWSSKMAQSLYRSLGFLDADFGLREYVWQSST